MTGRLTPEWIGKTPDTPVPPRVRVRIFDRYDGRCYLTGRKIMPGDDWHAEHIKALINGGENREGNLAPALRSAHKPKTDADLAEKARIASIRGKHIGARNKGPGRLQGRPFQKREKTHWRTAAELARMNRRGPSEHLPEDRP